MNIITLHPHGPIEVRRIMKVDVAGDQVAVTRAYVLVPLQPTVMIDGIVQFEATDISGEPDDVQEAAASHWSPARVETYRQFALSGD